MLPLSTPTNYIIVPIWIFFQYFNLSSQFSICSRLNLNLSNPFSDLPWLDIVVRVPNILNIP